MTKTPKDGQRVEVMLDGAWLPAVFVASNYVYGGEEEIWWFEHFCLDDGDLVPEDPRAGDPLPQWRELNAVHAPG